MIRLVGGSRNPENCADIQQTILAGADLPCCGEVNQESTKEKAQSIDMSCLAQLWKQKDQSLSKQWKRPPLVGKTVLVVCVPP